MHKTLAPRNSTPALVLAALACTGLAGLTPGCKSNAPSGSGATPPAQPATPPAAPAIQGPSVALTGFKFRPDTLEVTAGATVTWRNDDGVDHTVTSGPAAGARDGPINGTLKASGGTYSYTFDKPGEYPYHCDFHPAMKGKVVVK